MIRLFFSDLRCDKADIDIKRVPNEENDTRLGRGLSGCGSC